MNSKWLLLIFIHKPEKSSLEVTSTIHKNGETFTNSDFVLAPPWSVCRLAIYHQSMKTIELIKQSEGEKSAIF